MTRRFDDTESVVLVGDVMQGGDLDRLHFRRAVIYLTHGEPRVWRIRAELFPEHNEGASGWYGGRVLWGSDKATLEEAEEVGRAWVERGEMPLIQP